MKHTLRIRLNTPDLETLETIDIDLDRHSDKLTFTDSSCSPNVQISYIAEEVAAHCNLIPSALFLNWRN